MSEDRPWPIRDTLPEDSILRTFVDSLFEAGVILSFKKVLWTNPKTNLWTFGFTCVYLVWFSAPKWYFVWQNGVSLSQSWRLLGNMVRYRLALQWPGCEDVEGGGNVIFGCFEICYTGSVKGMITGDYSLKQHRTVEYLGCYLDSDLNGKSMACRVLKKINTELNFLWRQSNYLNY